jgi:hypothetical protein
MSKPIQVLLGCCITIIFKNNACNPPTFDVLVCANNTAYEQNMARLQTLPHIEIVQHGPSRVAY